MSRENRAGKWRSCAPRTGLAGRARIWICFQGSKKSRVVENLPKAPQGCGRASPDVEEGLQIQLGYQVSLAVGGDYEWALALQQDHGRMQVELARRRYGCS